MRQSLGSGAVVDEVVGPIGIGPTVVEVVLDDGSDGEVVVVVEATVVVVPEPQSLGTSVATPMGAFWGQGGVVPPTMKVSGALMYGSGSTPSAVAALLADSRTA